MDQVIPFVCLYDQIANIEKNLIVSDLKSVEHEDTEENNDFSVDPLADPRLDKMDLYNMVDSEDRDKIMSAQASFAVESADYSLSDAASNESTSDSGSGE